MPISQLRALPLERLAVQRLGLVELAPGAKQLRVVADRLERALVPISQLRALRQEAAGSGLRARDVCGVGVGGANTARGERGRPPGSFGLAGGEGRR